LGFTEGTQGEPAKWAPKTEASRQEERPTNKTDGTSDRGAVGRKLGVSRGNARRVCQRGAQNRGESPRGAPNQQNLKSQGRRCDGEKTWGFQEERQASRPEGRPKPRRVAKMSAQPTKPKEPATEVRCGKKLGVSRGKARRAGQRGAQNRSESARWAPNKEIRRGQRQRCGGEKTWGFQRERKASWPKGRPKPRRAGKRSAQTQHKASSRDGRPNEKTDPQRKRPHKGAVG
jgi:hypothetical protein